MSVSILNNFWGSELVFLSHLIIYMLYVLYKSVSYADSDGGTGAPDLPP